MTDRSYKKGIIQIERANGTVEDILVHMTTVYRKGKYPTWIVRWEQPITLHMGDRILSMPPVELPHDGL